MPKQSIMMFGASTIALQPSGGGERGAGAAQHIEQRGRAGWRSRQAASWASALGARNLPGPVVLGGEQGGGGGLTYAHGWLPLPFLADAGAEVAGYILPNSYEAPAVNAAKGTLPLADAVAEVANGEAEQEPCAWPHSQAPAQPCCVWRAPPPSC